MSAKNRKEPGFEEQMRQLEKLVEKLEGENLSLEDSIVTFEQAFSLARQCGLQLQAAEARVSVLMQGKEMPLPANAQTETNLQDEQE